MPQLSLLTQGRAALVDDADYLLLSRHKWHYHRSGYAARSEYIGTGRKDNRFRTVYMHRVIIDAPPGAVVDHINGDRLDNRRVNLRLCTAAENARNMRVEGAIPYKGVSLDRGRFRASITHEGRIIKIGRFDDAVAAARAYDDRARELFGEFARLNFPDG
jgi:hypothetical protein